MELIDRTISSLEVAEMTGKEHRHLLRDIKGYKEVLDQSPNLVSANFFIEHLGGQSKIGFTYFTESS